MKVRRGTRNGHYREFEQDSCLVRRGPVDDVDLGHVPYARHDREPKERPRDPVERASGFLGCLIAELFELSKLDQKSTEPSFESFSISELLQDVGNEFQLLAKRKKIELTLDLSNSNIMVIADIGLIQRVLENLIENAIKNTPALGRVAIAIVREAEQVKFMISDTGKGIQSHEIPHIFERYYQSPSTTDTRNGSAGLGLAIVKRILDLHHTRIIVNSKLNRGTTFTFYLRQNQPAALAIAG